MVKLIWHYLLLALLIFIFFSLHFQVTFSLSSSLPTSAQPLPCHPEQSIALLRFKNTFIIESFSYSKTESWKEGVDCCSWDGVTCDRLTGHVIGLDLSCSGLYGTIHSNSTLFLLPHLQKLNLAFNDFDRSPVSSNFGHFTNLTHLNLSSALFLGPIPSEITHLSNLISLDLSYNDQLTFPRQNFEKFLQNVTELNDLALDLVDMSSITPISFLNISSSLKSLRLDFCKLHGNFPDNIFRLPYLEELDLAGNNLIGSFPQSNWSSPLRILDLSANKFSGRLPSSIGNLKSLKFLILQDCNFTGTIPTSLGNLTIITLLYLTSNHLTGEISSSLSHLESLSQLYLSSNNLSGPIPDFMGNLSKITDLDLSHNNFSGQIPSSVFNLTQLSVLYFSSNRLVGQIPNQVNEVSILHTLGLSDNLLNGTMPSWLFILPSLRVLSLNNNQLTGQIHEFQSKSLEYLFLSKNEISGSLPSSVFELVNITFILLSSNNLSGNLNLDMFSKLKNLVELDLSESGLSLIVGSHGNSTWPKFVTLGLSSCNITNFPVFLKTQSLLQNLNLSHNKIYGEIPKWLWVTANNSLDILDLSHNFLTSLNPLHLIYPYYLDLRSNFIQGPLPVPAQQYSKPLSPSYIFFSNNKLTGEIPSSICNLTTVEIIDLSNNNLSGRIPECLGNFSSQLSVLNLRMNSFHGSIPKNFAKENSLRTLDLNGNHLEGPLPQSLDNCKHLEVLDLGNNKLNGTFPLWLESLPNLQVLILRSNRFHGSIDDPKSGFSFPKLRILDLSHNVFTGLLLTKYFEILKAMMNLDEEKVGAEYMGEYSPNDYYHDSVVLTMKGVEFEFVRILTIFTTIDLSNNRFHGEIPKSLGNLNSLRVVNLSQNSLSGHIPSSLGKMTALESLDLSSNKLVGEIPQQMTNLTFLEVLNLSQNLLVGQIPRGKQFDTFDNSSYMGNSGLCGFPLSKRCSNDEAPQLPPPVFHEEDDSTSGFDWKIAAMGYGCGLVFGLSMGYIVFATAKPWWFVKMVEGDWHDKVLRISQGFRRRSRRRRNF